MTLRQRLRSDANDKLLAVGKTAYAGVERALEEHSTNIDAKDLMKFMSGTQVASLQDKLITQLANEAEAEIEAIYNRQQGLNLGEDDDKS
jgi:hypothetical protein